jgi:threonine/homoserine/homoserine lactone efflux protein
MELILTIAGIHLVACLSPGPDIFLVVLNSLRHGWRTGIATTAGILTGVTIQITLGITGITYLLTRGAAIERGIAMAGGAWLLYLGARSLASSRKGKPAGNTPQSIPVESVRLPSAWLQGFFVNLLNPKALLFFLSLFSVMLGPEIPIPLKVACGITMIGVQALAFSTVAILMDQTRFKDQWIRLQLWLDWGISIILIFLGVWIWLINIISLIR